MAGKVIERELISVTAVCHQCGKESTVQTDTHVQAIQALENVGWKLNSRNSLCPRCVREKQHAGEE